MDKLSRGWHGTTTVGIIAGDYVVLAADKRATAGTMIASRTVKKIVKLTDYAAMTISGLVADAQVLADAVREEARFYELDTGKRLSVYSMATLLANILSSSKYFPYLVQLIVGGYDAAPRLYAIDPYGGVTEERVTSSGSGSPVALGVLERGYNEKLSLDDAINLAAEAVRSAILRDSATGDGIDITVIGRSTYQEKFIPFQQH
ncbi:archaeal proteasome endopeptidase complex subunit beta [Acidilobus sp. 7A]|jgi:proteasome beta subunit|uniref:archaeal proteasome endopeptidase complex subunit beta n=1 Tax=Acidilobus sp. 7A TaxID=1577685 RepID=UPI000764EAAD|nr:proteasome subunit beta [Acidilobus sp. 7A]